jgi:hypothetical protein
MRDSLVRPEADAVAACIVDDGIDASERLDIYRNTITATLLRALQLSYPAVRRVVGPAFFDFMGQDFILERPPCSGDLNDYGAEFPEFLTRFKPAAVLSYLPDVAWLEWAVNLALHAPQAKRLDIQRLAAVRLVDHARLRLVPDPSVSLLGVSCPADSVWRAVLEGDDISLAAIDLAAGPVWLIVQRLPNGIDVTQLEWPEWRFVRDLCAGRTLDEIREPTDAVAALDRSAVLAKHLYAGRFVDFSLADTPAH